MPADVLEREGDQAEQQGGGFENAKRLAAELKAATAEVQPAPVVEARPVSETTPGTLDMTGMEARLAAAATEAPASESMDADALARAEELVRKVDTDAATRENYRWNDMVEARRRSEQAEKARDEEYGVQLKASLAAELLGQLKGQPISETTRAYLAEGGSLDQVLAELTEYNAEGAKTGKEKVEAVDKELSDARRGLVEASLKKRGILHREEKAEAKKTAEERYLKAFADKLEHLTNVPKGDKELALESGYIQQVLDKMAFDSENLTLEELAGNQLHVLTDLLCREQLMRQQVAESLSDKGANKLVKFLKTNKLVHGAVAGAVFAASAVSLAHGMPDGAQSATDIVLKGTGFLSAYITSRELLEGTVDSVQGIGQRRQRKQQREALAADKQLADLTLQTVYNRVEALPEDRKGTDDAAENLHRFEAIQTDFADLHTAPGGKPYSAEAILDYASQLYLERKQELEQIVAQPDPESRKQAYQEMARMILSQDVEQMQDRISAGRAKRAIYRGVSIVSSVVTNNIVANMLNNVSDSQKAAHALPRLVQTELQPRQL